MTSVGLAVSFSMPMGKKRARSVASRRAARWSFRSRKVLEAITPR